MEAFALLTVMGWNTSHGLAKTASSEKRRHTDKRLLRLRLDALTDKNL
jgi:hypothetical protein